MEIDDLPLFGEDIEHIFRSPQDLTPRLKSNELPLFGDDVEHIFRSPRDLEAEKKRKGFPFFCEGIEHIFRPPHAPKPFRLLGMFLPLPIDASMQLT